MAGRQHGAAQHSTAQLKTGQIAPLLSSALRRNSDSDLDSGEFTDAEQSREQRIRRTSRHEGEENSIHPEYNLTDIALFCLTLVIG